MQEFTHDDVKDFLLKYIDIRSVLYVPEKNHLTPREKEYLIGCIVKRAEGKDLLSEEVKNYLQEQLMFKNRSVDIYRGKLKEKGWMIQTPDSVVLPPDLTFENNKIPKKIKFSFCLKRES